MDSHLVAVEVGVEGRADPVSYTHLGQLGTGLADGLSSDDTDRLTELDAALRPIFQQLPELLYTHSLAAPRTCICLLYTSRCV